jgi:hypothetical protein
VRKLRALEGHRKKSLYWNLVFFVATTREVGKVYIYRSDFQSRPYFLRYWCLKIRPTKFKFSNPWTYKIILKMFQEARTCENWSRGTLHTHVYEFQVPHTILGSKLGVRGPKSFFFLIR